MRNSNPYLRALASPGALRFSAAGFLGRLQISMFGLGTVLLISSLSGRYGLAGAVAAAGAAGYALVSPLVARLADRAGQRAVLRPLMLVFAAATAALIAGAQARAPAWVLLAASGLAGAATPQLGSMVRARWSALLAGSPLLHAAVSLESVADEVIFVAGPVLVTLLATEVYPASGIAVAAATCLAGTLLLAAQRATEPPLHPAHSGGPVPGAGRRARAQAARRGDPRRVCAGQHGRRPLVRLPGLARPAAAPVHGGRVRGGGWDGNVLGDARPGRALRGYVPLRAGALADGDRRVQPR